MHKCIWIDLWWYNKCRTVVNQALQKERTARGLKKSNLLASFSSLTLTERYFPFRLRLRSKISKTSSGDSSKNMVLFRTSLLNATVTPNIALPLPIWKIVRLLSNVWKRNRREIKLWPEFFQRKANQSGVSGRHQAPQGQQVNLV